MPHKPGAIVRTVTSYYVCHDCDPTVMRWRGLTHVRHGPFVRRRAAEEFAAQIASVPGVVGAVATAPDPSR